MLNNKNTSYKLVRACFSYNFIVKGVVFTTFKRRLTYTDNQYAHMW